MYVMYTVVLYLLVYPFSSYQWYKLIDLCICKWYHLPYIIGVSVSEPPFVDSTEVYGVRVRVRMSLAHANQPYTMHKQKAGLLNVHWW